MKLGKEAIALNEIISVLVKNAIEMLNMLLSTVANKGVITILNFSIFYFFFK